MAGSGFQGMPKGVSKVEEFPNTMFLRILFNDLHFGSSRIGHCGQQRISRLPKLRRIGFFQLTEALFTRKEGGFDYLTEARVHLSGRKSSESVHIANHKEGLMKSPHKVLSFREIYGGFTTQSGVRHRKQGGWDGAPPNPPQQSRGQESTHVGCDPTTNGNQNGLPVHSLLHDFSSEGVSFM
jgi:hypothetical protein